MYHMDSPAVSHDLDTLLCNLSADDLSRLRQQLLRQDSIALLHNSRRISREELLAAEAWFWEQTNDAHGPREHWARLRMWLIFMLLRYGGLRLSEIFALERRHFDWKKGLIVTHGSHARTVPLSLEVSHRLQHVLDDPHHCPRGGLFLHCDASLVRRTMQRCGSACGMPKGLLSARNLRQSRALELGLQGLPLPAVNIFLGRCPAPEAPLLYDTQEATRLLYQHIKKERHMQTSARNVFQGRIFSLRQTGLLVEVVILTAGGLRIIALITDESCHRLALKQHTLVNASVKAPWVLVNSVEERHSGAENCYEAVIDRVREDETVMEILATLPEGSQICALHSRGEVRPQPCPGDRVHVSFKAFSVILNLA